MESQFSKLLDYLEQEEKNNSVGKILKQSSPTESIDKKSECSSCETKVDNFKDLVSHDEHFGKKKVYNKPKKKIVTKTSVGFNVSHFETLMKERLKKHHVAGQSYERPYVSVSELYSCLRKCYFSRMKYSTDLDEQYKFSYLDLINHIGNSIHDYVQAIYPFDENEKTIISKKYGVKGRIDGLSKNYIVEIKTVDPTKIPTSILRKHFLQANIYCHIMNEEYGYDIRNMTIVYVSRDLKQIVPFDEKYNRQEAIEYLENGTYLRKCLDGKIIPELKNIDEEECFYCPFKSDCKNTKNIEEVPKKKPSNYAFLL